MFARGLAVRGVPGWPWGEAAGAFVTGAVAVADGLEAGAVIEAANAAGEHAVVTAYAPVGPVADGLDGLDVSLAASGLLLVRVRRGWDERLWPFATKGFLLSGSTWRCRCCSASGEG
jgi:deoxyribodipyrimidine photo-lyase